MKSKAEGERAMLERYRDYLGLLARLQVERRLHGKIDLYGVVQQTLLEAYRALPRFQARNQDDLAVWLRRILAHNLADELRKLKTAKRSLGRERSLEAALAESSSRLAKEAFTGTRAARPPAPGRLRVLAVGDPGHVRPVWWLR
jgi:DNA-directed RNA polymerase specialized sigma24 family protein